MALPAWMDPRKIRFVTIHCTADIRGSNKSAADVNAWDIKKYGQRSYHYIILLDGTVVVNLRHDQRGAHVGKNNTGNLGIAYVGGLEKDGKTIADTRTPAQLAAMEKLVRELHAQYPAARILGHRDWSPDTNGNGKIDKWEWLKGCPCFDVADWLKAIGL